MEEQNEQTQVTPILNNKAFSIVRRNNIYHVVQINFNDATGTIGDIQVLKVCENRAHANESFRIEVANSKIFSE